MRWGRWLVVAVISITVEGDPLAAAQAATKDLTPALEQSVATWRSLVAEEFSVQAWRPPSGPFRAWAPVLPFGNRPAPARILHRSGALAAAMQGGAGGFTRITMTKGEFGLTGLMATIGAVHRGGAGEVRAADSTIPQRIGVTTKLRWKLGLTFGVWLKASTTEILIPRRPFATVSPELRTRVTAIFSAFIVGRPVPEDLVA